MNRATPGETVPDPNASASAWLLHQRIEARTARVGILGLGYVGLPLAAEFARSGFQVIGIDVEPARVAKLQAGESYIDDVPPTDLAPLVEQGRLQASLDF